MSVSMSSASSPKSKKSSSLAPSRVDVESISTENRLRAHSSKSRRRSADLFARRRHRDHRSKPIIRTQYRREPRGPRLSLSDEAPQELIEAIVTKADTLPYEREQKQCQ